MIIFLLLFRYSMIIFLNDWLYNLSLQVNLQQFEETECAALFPPHRHLKHGYDHEKQMCYGNHKEIVDTCEVNTLLLYLQSVPLVGDCFMFNDIEKECVRRFCCNVCVKRSSVALDCHTTKNEYNSLYATAFANIYVLMATLELWNKYNYPLSSITNTSALLKYSCKILLDVFHMTRHSIIKTSII